MLFKVVKHRDRVRFLHLIMFLAEAVTSHESFLFQSLYNIHLFTTAAAIKTRPNSLFKKNSSRQRPVKAEVDVKAALASLNTAFLPISRSYFKRR